MEAPSTFLILISFVLFGGKRGKTKQPEAGDHYSENRKNSYNDRYETAYWEDTFNLS